MTEEEWLAWRRQAQDAAVYAAIAGGCVAASISEVESPIWVYIALYFVLGTVTDKVTARGRP